MLRCEAQGTAQSASSKPKQALEKGGGPGGRFESIIISATCVRAASVLFGGKRLQQNCGAAFM